VDGQSVLCLERVEPALLRRLRRLRITQLDLRKRELHVDTVTACEQYYPRQN
jgi:hypothetical protein